MADDRQWLALAELLGDEALGEEYATLDGRLANHDELDALIARWTLTRSATAAAGALQAAGIAAHEVLDNTGVLHDPQVAERRWFQIVESKRFADGDVFSGHPIHLGDTPGEWWRAGPSMGQDTVATLAPAGRAVGRRGGRADRRRRGVRRRRARAQAAPAVPRRPRGGPAAGRGARRDAVIGDDGRGRDHCGRARGRAARGRGGQRRPWRFGRAVQRVRHADVGGARRRGRRRRAARGSPAAAPAAVRPGHRRVAVVGVLRAGQAFGGRARRAVPSWPRCSPRPTW